ncbi:hypothetical protein JCM10212_000287 [Sporobolomyces blumeae]
MVGKEQGGAMDRPSSAPLDRREDLDLASSLFAGTSFIACVVYAYTTRPGSTLPSVRSPALWYTTIHLSTNLLQSVYEVPQHAAGQAASVPLLSPTFLYPIVGWALDKRPDLMASLYMTVPISIAVSYGCLSFISAVVPYYVAFVPAAIGVGMGPLLSVLVVPRIVQRDIGDSCPPQIARDVGRWLLSTSHASTSSELEDPFPTLAMFFLTALVQLGLVSTFWTTMRRRGLDASSTAELEADKAPADHQRSVRMRMSTERLRRSGELQGQYGLLRGTDATSEDIGPRRDDGDSRSDSEEDDVGEDLEALEYPARTVLGDAELKRGRRALFAAGSVVVFSWLCFLSNLVR